MPHIEAILIYISILCKIGVASLRTDIEPKYDIMLSICYFFGLQCLKTKLSWDRNTNNSESQQLYV